MHITSLEWEDLYELGLELDFLTYSEGSHCDWDWEVFLDKDHF